LNGLMIASIFFMMHRSARVDVLASIFNPLSERGTKD
jgi:hypothetical protein